MLLMYMLESLERSVTIPFICSCCHFAFVRDSRKSSPGIVAL